MKELYTKEQVQKLTLNIRKLAALCIALVVVAIAEGITTCFFVNESNAVLLKIINIVVSSVCLCVALYFLLNGILPVRARKNFISRLLNSPTIKLKGRVIGRGKSMTNVKYIELTELHISDENGKEHILYWDLENGDPDFEGHIIVFDVVNNKIVRYGEAE